MLSGVFLFCLSIISLDVPSPNAPRCQIPTFLREFLGKSNGLEESLEDRHLSHACILSSLYIFIPGGQNVCYSIYGALGALKPGFCFQWNISHSSSPVSPDSPDLRALCLATFRGSAVCSLEYQSLVVSRAKNHHHHHHHHQALPPMQNHVGTHPSYVSISYLRPIQIISN